MRFSLLLLVSAISGLVLSQTVADNGNIADSYSSYVSEMESAASVATKTYSWARVSSMTYKTTQPASVEQAQATLPTSNAVTSSESLASLETLAVATQTVSSSATKSGDNNMMAYGIGIAFGVLILIVGLVTSMVIYNRKQARKQFLKRTEGLKQMTETQA